MEDCNFSVVNQLILAHRLNLWPSAQKVFLTKKLVKLIFDKIIADCDAVLPGKGREWIDSVEKIGCKQLKWRCPLESVDLEDDSDEVDHASQEAECAALKLIHEAPGKVP